MGQPTEDQNRAARRFPSAGIEVDGARIRELRKERCIELADLAAKIGRSRPYLTKIEIGTSTRVSPTTLARIAEALELTDRQRRSLMKRPNRRSSEPAQAAA